MFQSANKQLFGIAGSKNMVARNARSIIRERLNLLHTNIKQPVFDALAEQTGYTAYELEHHVDLYRKLPTHEFSAIELFNQIECSLLDDDPHALTTAAEESMLSKSAAIAHASGYLVSGIDSDYEAQWLRECGGILIHLIDQNATHSDRDLFIDYRDYIIVVTNTAEPTTPQLDIVINRILRDMQEKKAA